MLSISLFEGNALNCICLYKVKIRQECNLHIVSQRPRAPALTGAEQWGL